MGDAKILYMRPANARTAGIRDLPAQRTPPLTRQFLDTLTPAVIYTGGYRWIGGGHNWRLDDTWYGIEYIDQHGTVVGHWLLTGGSVPAGGVTVADPTEAVTWLRDRNLITDPKAGA